MQQLESVEIKTFIPAKDFQLSKGFYTDIGFTKCCRRQWHRLFQTGQK